MDDLYKDPEWNQAVRLVLYGLKKAVSGQNLEDMMAVRQALRMIPPALEVMLKKEKAYLDAGFAASDLDKQMSEIPVN
jgi:hypothetical protein